MQEHGQLYGTPLGFFAHDEIQRKDLRSQLDAQKALRD